MNAQQLLQEISDYCRQTGLAESTFGRRAVNDGKLTNRLRNGGRITTDTLDRIRSFMAENRDLPARQHGVNRPALMLPKPQRASALTAPAHSQPFTARRPRRPQHPPQHRPAPLP